MTEAQPIRIPVEISRPPAVFDLVVRGYDRRQVDEHVSRLEQELAELAWQRDVLDAERQQVRAGREELDADQARWAEEKADWQPSFAALGERVNEILSMSQTEAEQLRARTAREIAEDKKKAEQEIAMTRESFGREAAESKAELRQDLDLMKRDAEVDAAQIVHNARTEAEQLVAAARHEADGIKIRANEILAAARQERTKIVLQMNEITTRLGAVKQYLAEVGEPPAKASQPGAASPEVEAALAPVTRKVVQIDALEP